MLERQFLKGYKKYFLHLRFDLILYSTPPITLTKVVTFIKKKDAAVSYLLLKDIFPQNAVDLGMIKKGGLIHKFFLKKEKQLYQVSDFIGCMSPANVNFLLKHNPQISPLKVEVNPNTIEPVRVDIAIVEKKAIRKQYGIPTDAVALIYGGNLGKPQGIDFLLEVLKSNTNTSNIFFVLVGSGTQYKHLQNWFTNYKPQNALLLNSIAKREYDLLLSACDVGLIFLDKRFTIPNFPSRLLSYLENRMPILSATDKHTDLGKITEEFECGFWVEAGDLEGYNQIVQTLSKKLELVTEMGKNSIKLLTQKYTVDISYNLIQNRVTRGVKHD